MVFRAERTTVNEGLRGGALLAENQRRTVIRIDNQRFGAAVAGQGFKTTGRCVDNDVAAAADFDDIQAVLVASVGKQAEYAVDADIAVRFGNCFSQAAAVLSG